MPTNHPKQNKFVIVFEFEDFAFAKSKEEFIEVMKQEIGYGTKDLMETILEEYNRRQYTVD